MPERYQGTVETQEGRKEEGDKGTRARMEEEGKKRKKMLKISTHLT